MTHLFELDTAQQQVDGVAPHISDSVSVWLPIIGIPPSKAASASSVRL
jgi:hypothetical protein